MQMRFLSASDSALLVELDDLACAMALHHALLARPIAEVKEMVPAARTVLLHYQSALITCAALIEAVQARGAVADVAAVATQSARVVEIPVCYDGEDLPYVAEVLGLTVREVIARHTDGPWLGAFAGFAPGFVYMAGGHPCFQVPRRTSPRTRVPVGSVALAGDFTAVYPKASPGGWQLIGTTGVPMWDMERAEPAYVQPGFQVQFRDAGRAALVISLPPSPHPSPSFLVYAQHASRAPSPQPLSHQGRGAFTPLSPCGGGAEGEESHVLLEKMCVSASPSSTKGDGLSGHIQILSTGLQTLVQDAGRAGMAGLGLSPSGALDTEAMREANRLVGNPLYTAVLENLLGGLQLHCTQAVTLAVTGADVPLTLRAADGRSWPVSPYRGIALDAGDSLLLGTPLTGVYCYVAARGGWQVDAVLGSCATDTLAQLGPAALHAGQWLDVGQAPALQAVQLADDTRPALPRNGDVVTLDITLGPRTDWFTPEAVQLLTAQEWHVTPQSSRVGIRLAGAKPLARSRLDELPSEGTVTGAIQVPASGQPVLFLADHPLTGGYPVIAAVASHHLGLAAQIPVGCRVRFHVITPFIVA